MNTRQEKTLGVIPARYASTRFPGKPLVDIGGKTMIRRVYEQACKANLDQIVIATDDKRIADEVASFGGDFIMTAGTHQSGTDRCAEVAERLGDFEVIINIQGDEPFINPAQISLVRSCFEDETVNLATLVKPVKDEEELFNVNIPKVVLNNKQQAIYFSRQTLPYIRSVDVSEWLTHYPFYKHIGIYGYRKSTLLELTKLKPSSLELAESLEQLRWIENGYQIQTKVTNLETIAIDNPEDLKKIKL